ncbi:hypothetical protein SmJEL517_g03485 [Synchytrium microbalum]|uniref:CRIB domain-containing protein n=1 Tax=Synchytrium microbalum TaxID=1806994 RepID=A0A507BWL2_9FUNG|nr:uncharacterized protein SmJEL517_g03485 [Synchytrium microbalum]TPX33740.1 hypothetical protein SmJEL517_g03485 [Synchytrium microbalum]
MGIALSSVFPTDTSSLPKDPKYQGIGNPNFNKQGVASSSSKSKSNSNSNAARKAKQNSAAAARLRKTKGFRDKVAGGKIVIGEPLKETFRHTTHVGAADYKAGNIDSKALAVTVL